MVALAPRLQADGIKIQGVRLDSGDLTALSKSVRNILDEGGLKDVRILASGGLDEDNIGEMLRAGAPTSCRNMQTCRAANIRPAKRPGPAASRFGVNTAPTEAWPAIILVETDRQPGQPLMEMVMQNGRRIRPSPPSSEIRDRAARRLEQLPEPLRRLETGFSYSVKIADALIELSKQVDRRLAEQELADA